MFYVHDIFTITSAKVIGYLHNTALWINRFSNSIMYVRGWKTFNNKRLTWHFEVMLCKVFVRGAQKTWCWITIELLLFWSGNKVYVVRFWCEKLNQISTIDTCMFTRYNYTFHAVKREIESRQFKNLRFSLFYSSVFLICVHL